MRELPAKPAEPSRDSRAEPPVRTDIRRPRHITSEQLFGAAIEVQIDHRGMLYRLRQTSLGKLILTK